MKFEKEKPKVNCLNALTTYKNFSSSGVYEFSEFLKSFLNLEEVRIQALELKRLLAWLEVPEISDVIEVPHEENAICLVSQIRDDSGLVAYFPYVIKGKNVKDYYKAKSLLPKIAEAISDQISMCYMLGFKGGDWLFGENLAKVMVANCISSNKYDGMDFTHLIEIFEKLASSTFEGEFFSTGAIVSSDVSKYKENALKLDEQTNIDDIHKRKWFLADGRDTFFLFNNAFDSRAIYRKTMKTSGYFVKDYFNAYYLADDLKAPDFVIRTVAPNEIAISDLDGKEFVKVENVWRYRHHKNIAPFLHDYTGASYKVSYAILYYTLFCSRNRISSIIWVPKECGSKDIQKLITPNSAKVLRDKLSVLEDSHEVLVKKLLASDGAIVINHDGDIQYESVFADTSAASDSKNELKGSGETAASLLARNGVAIKISQDGTIKIYYSELNKEEKKYEVKKYCY